MDSSVNNDKLISTLLPVSPRHKWTPPPRNPSQTGRYSIYLPRRDGRLSWPGWRFSCLQIHSSTYSAVHGRRAQKSNSRQSFDHGVRKCILNKKLSYRRETARHLHTSFLARSLIAHFTEHHICWDFASGTKWQNTRPFITRKSRYR